MKERAPAWPVAVAALVAVAVFLPSLGHGFVYDDHRFLASNTALHDTSILWRAFTDPAAQTADGTHAGLWRPLRTLSFALDHLLFGDAAWGPHLVNVLLHGVGTALVGLLLRRLGAGVPAVLLGALVYAVHPVQVECVAWVSSRGDLLAAALVWAALLLQLRGHVRTAWGAGALALLAKEQAVVWPALAFLVVLDARRDWRAAARGAVVPAAAVVVFVVLRQAVLDEPFQEGGLTGVSVGIGRIARMVAHQAWFTTLPVGAVFDWQMPAGAAAPARVALGLVAVATLLPLAFRATRVPAAWFHVALVPTLYAQVLVPLNILVADRFLLFALPALALLVARGAQRAPRVAPAAALVVLALGALTWQAEQAWASDATLWQRTADRVPRHWRAQAWLGVAALRDGDPERAVRCLEQAVGASPADAKTRFLLAEALEARAAATGGDAIVAATRRARDAYLGAEQAFASGRQEGRSYLAPLARVRAIDLTLGLGEIDAARGLLEQVLRVRTPRIPEGQLAVWERSIERLARHVEEHVDPGLARRLRAWSVPS